MYESCKESAEAKWELTPELDKILKEVNDIICKIIEQDAFSGTKKAPEYVENDDKGYIYFQTLMSAWICVHVVINDLVKSRDRTCLTKEQLTDEMKYFNKNIRPFIHKWANLIAEKLKK